MSAASIDGSVLVALCVGSAVVAVSGVYGWRAFGRTKTYVDSPDGESGTDTRD